MNKTKITFLNPPFLKNYSRPQRSPAVTKSGTLYFPMWLAYAAGFAEQGGHDIDLIDAPAASFSKPEVIQKIKAFAAELVVVETSTPSIYNDIEFCELLKKELPDVVTILVGTHVSALPEETIALSASVDAVAIGEYDQTIRNIADRMAHGSDFKDVAGICYQSLSGPVATKRQTLIDNLDTLPMVSTVYNRFLNIKNYFNPNALYPMVTITTSRGCPHRCIFCVYPQTMMGHRLRLRSVADVVAEIEYIVNAFPEAKSIFFEDDTFTAHKKRCIRICAEIVKRNINISWTANARADLDIDTLQMMSRAGCRCLCVGFESGNQYLLDNIKKGISIDQARAFMNAARKAGILVHGCFIVGLPGETVESMNKTLDLAIALRPDGVQFYPVMVYPGTEAYKWYDERNLIATKDFSKWLTPAGLHNTVVRGENLTSLELVNFCDSARRAFYLRPRYIIYKLLQMVKNPREIKRTLKSLRTFTKYLFAGTDLT